MTFAARMMGSWLRSVFKLRKAVLWWRIAEFPGHPQTRVSRDKCNVVTLTGEHIQATMRFPERYAPEETLLISYKGCARVAQLICTGKSAASQSSSALSQHHVPAGRLPQTNIAVFGFIDKLSQDSDSSCLCAKALHDRVA